MIGNPSSQSRIRRVSANPAWLGIAVPVLSRCRWIWEVQVGFFSGPRRPPQPLSGPDPAAACATSARRFPDAPDGSSSIDLPSRTKPLWMVARPPDCPIMRLAGRELWPVPRLFRGRIQPTPRDLFRPIYPAAAAPGWQPAGPPAAAQNGRGSGLPQRVRRGFSNQSNRRKSQHLNRGIALLHIGHRLLDHFRLRRGRSR